MRKKSDFDTLVEVMDRLRSEDGCPWDREQTHASLKPFLLEETYEVLEAIDLQDDKELCNELGDLLLQVVFHAQIAREEKRFCAAEVCRAIVDKLVRRHPHVFGDGQAENPDQVLANWEEIKREERSSRGEPASILDGVPRHLPALLRAQRLQAKAARVGFDWQHIDGPLDKVEEEFAELRQAWDRGDGKDVEEEFGDLLFALVNTARFLDLCPEDALRRAAGKFESRFRAVETILKEQKKEINEVSLKEMDRIWDQVKGG